MLAESLISKGEKMSPLYSYECPSCEQTTDKVFKIADCPKSIECKCGKRAKKIIVIGGLQTDGNVPWLASTVEQMRPDYDTRPIETRTALKKYLKDNGLIWTG